MAAHEDLCGGVSGTGVMSSGNDQEIQHIKERTELISDTLEVDILQLLQLYGRLTRLVEVNLQVVRCQGSGRQITI